MKPNIVEFTRATISSGALIVLLFSMSIPSYSQNIEYVGLAGNELTSMQINYGIIAVGTDSNGVFHQTAFEVSDTSWTRIPLDTMKVTAVYPHKSGPLGWAISAGVMDYEGDGPYVYCSYLGEAFVPNSDGITPNLALRISALDGYPDPTICGETFAAGSRAVFRRAYGDSVWMPVFTATIEGAINTVKVLQELPGIVLAGGADGFAGFLMARSDDFGDTWTDISPPGMIYSIDFAGDSASTIFAVASSQIFRSLDGGVSWEPVFLENAYHFTELIYLEDNRTIYAAGRQWVSQTALILRSTDNGDSWEVFDLPEYGPIIGLDMAGDGWIYFATRDEGVFRFMELTTATKEIVQIEQDLAGDLQISPNPFRATTWITFDLHAPVNIVLEAYDQSGRQVAVLAEGQISAGPQAFYWETGELSAGIYTVVLKTEDSYAARQVVHVK